MTAGIYRVDGAQASYEAFRRAAIDPAGSAVVDACAGSGKTTLLVARIVCALLDGAAPDQVLAVTFTRLAAHEMRQRLMHQLRELAMAGDRELDAMLGERFGLPAGPAQPLRARARGLYEAVLGDPRGPQITTFHRWFWQVARMAPMALELSGGAELTEEGAGLQQQAWFDWLEALQEPAAAERREDLEALVAAIGLNGTRQCLMSLLDQRAEWAIAFEVDADAPLPALQAGAGRAHEQYAGVWLDEARAQLAEAGVPPQRMDDPLPDSPVARDAARAPGSARAPGAPGPPRPPRPPRPPGAPGAPDPPGRFVAALAASAQLAGSVADFEAILRTGSDASQRTADQLGQVLAAMSRRDPGWLAQAESLLLTRKGDPRKLAVHRALRPAVEAAGGEAAVGDRWVGLAVVLRRAGQLCREWQGVVLNARLMRCGADLLAGFQQAKRALGVIDFADLETIAWRLLRDPASAAFVQARLDCRYRQLLFDEFQDTSSLQWRIVADWLQSYAGAGERPGVFVVGDPRQSIYRFRRAEARVFDAAKALLDEGFEARRVATDTTRRNAPAIVEALNRCLPDAMPTYREQVTLAEGGRGLFWRLPLVRGDGEDGGGADEGGVPEGGGHEGGVHERRGARDAAHAAARGDPPAAAGFDWLSTPREDEESLRYREGLAIADAIEAARAEVSRQGTAVAWGDVFVLARSRSSFPAYERALRRKGLPVQSDRAGGLLATLEADDLRALLAFVRAPYDDLAMVQLLRSPLVGLGDAPLQRLAARALAEGGRGRWWTCLCDDADAGIAEVAVRLRGWIALAAQVPVHDFLDAVLAQTDAFARYPEVVEPAQRAVSHANLNAMLGLALDVDAGRHPSLARFLHRLRAFDSLDEREGPSEGRSDGVDAIRLMTIHAAKGLEAGIVVLADAHRAEPPSGPRLFIDWPPESPRPRHASFQLGGDLAGRSRRAAFEREAELQQRENENLLYVALTRGKHGVIVSGVATRRAPAASWYTVLQAVHEAPQPPAVARATHDDPAVECAGFDMSLLALPALDVGTRLSGRERAPDADVATELGTALHRALELLTTRGAVPCDDTLDAALCALALDRAQRAAALDLARRVLALAKLAPAFAPQAPAANEFEILGADGAGRRIDRLVRVGAECWIIDYKWSVAPAMRDEYVAQLRDYRTLVAQLDPMPLGARGPIRTVLVDASAGRIEFDPA